MLRKSRRDITIARAVTPEFYNLMEEINRVDLAAFSLLLNLANPEITITQLNIEWQSLRLTSRKLRPKIENWKMRNSGIQKLLDMESLQDVVPMLKQRIRTTLQMRSSAFSASIRPCRPNY